MSHKNNLHILEEHLGNWNMFSTQDIKTKIKLSTILEERKTKEERYYFAKRNNGDEGIQDPHGGDSLVLTSGDNILKNWEINNLSDETIRILKLINSNELENYLGENNFKKYVKDQLMCYPILEIKGNTLKTRYCGMDISEIGEKFGFGEVLQKAWKNKPEGFWIPSFYGLISEFSTFLKSNGENSITNLFEVNILNPWNSLNKNYFKVLDLDLLVNILNLENTLNDLLEKDQKEKEILLFSLLLTKSFYIERSINGLGILHPHLHSGNVTYEWVKKDLSDITNLDYSPENIIFDMNEGFENLKNYKPVVRMIDIQGLEMIKDWPIKIL